MEIWKKKWQMDRLAREAEIDEKEARERSETGRIDREKHEQEKVAQPGSQSIMCKATPECTAWDMEAGGEESRRREERRQATVQQIERMKKEIRDEEIVRIRTLARRMDVWSQRLQEYHGA